MNWKKNYKRLTIDELVARGESAHKKKIAREKKELALGVREKRVLLSAFRGELDASGKTLDEFEIDPMWLYQKIRDGELWGKRNIGAKTIHKFAAWISKVRPDLVLPNAPPEPAE